MTDELYVILKEYLSLYFPEYYKVNYLLNWWYILWAEQMVLYSIVHFKLTLICVIMIILNKTKKYIKNITKL